MTTAPMPWANRFGGPGTSRGSTPRRVSIGVSTRVTSWPSGLNRGPASTRATKPYASGRTSHVCPNSRAVAAITTTPPATNRADTSFTGLGKLNSRDMAPQPYPTKLVSFRGCWVSRPNRGGTAATA